MAFDPSRYPPNWPTLAQAAKERSGWRCEACGAAHGALAISRRNRLYRVTLAACHVTPDDTANPAATLVALCSACHLRMDAMQHWRTRRRLARARLIAAGQVALL